MAYLSELCQLHLLSRWEREKNAYCVCFDAEKEKEKKLCLLHLFTCLKREKKEKKSAYCICFHAERERVSRQVLPSLTIPLSLGTNNTYSTKTNKWPDHRTSPGLHTAGYKRLRLDLQLGHGRKDDQIYYTVGRDRRRPSPTGRDAAMGYLTVGGGQPREIRLSPY